MNAEIPSSKAITPLRSGGKMASIVPQSFEEVQRLATMAVRAGIGSYGYRDTPEQCIAKATAAIMHGMELNLSPMQSLSGIAVINGKTTIYGDLLTAVLWANGFKIKKWIDGEGDERVARAKITRPDGEVIEAKFSVAQAKQARLWDTRETIQKKSRDGNGTYAAPNDSAWFRFAEDMLEWKAVGRCVRAGASDATRGLMILEDMESLMIDVTPSAAAPAISNATDIPEIPEVPSVPTVPEETQVSPSDDPRLSPDQEQQFLEKLSDEIAIAGNSDAVQEVAEMYAGILDRMSDEGRRAAEKIIEGRG